MRDILIDIIYLTRVGVMCTAASCLPLNLKALFAMAEGGGRPEGDRHSVNRGGAMGRGERPSIEQ